MIPVCVPFIGEKELEYVVDCLKTNWISSKGGVCRGVRREVCRILRLQIWHHNDKRNHGFAFGFSFD